MVYLKNLRIITTRNEVIEINDISTITIGNLNPKDAYNDDKELFIVSSYGNIRLPMDIVDDIKFTFRIVIKNDPKERYVTTGKEG